MKFFPLLLLMLAPLVAGASSTRTLDADSLISSDHTKSYPLPASPGTLSIGGRTLNPQTGTTYTFALTDGSNTGTNPLVTGTNASTQTYTVPPHSSVAFPTSPATQIDVCQLGAGKLTIAQGAGVTIISAGSNKSIGAQGVCVTLVQLASDSWLLTGNLIP